MSQLGAQAPTTAKPADGQAGRPGRRAHGRDHRRRRHEVFNVTEIAAKRGETIKIQLKNVGTLPKMAMAHNVVVVKPTTKLAEFNQAAAMRAGHQLHPASNEGGSGRRPPTWPAPARPWK